MAQVNIICQGYNGAYAHLNGLHYIDVTHRKFLAATLTIGFQRFHNVLQAGPRLWLHRVGQGLSALSYLTDEFGDLRLAPDHHSLDGSEKSGMSYWHGMVFAKLATAEILGIRWLLHADAMEKSGRLHRNPPANPANKKSKKRADMAGQDDQMRWHVVEAKGFSRGLPPNAVQNAKDQAGVVSSIDNTVPETTSASVACLWKSPIEIVLDDPPPSGGEQWSIKNDDFWSSYYEGLADYIRRAKKPKTHAKHPGFVFASLSPLLGIIPRSQRPPNWATPMIGLPEVLLKDVTLAPKIIPRLLANGVLDNVAEDGVALVGSVGDFN